MDRPHKLLADLAIFGSGTRVERHSDHRDSFIKFRSCSKGQVGGGRSAPRGNDEERGDGLGRLFEGHPREHDQAERERPEPAGVHIRPG